MAQPDWILTQRGYRPLWSTAVAVASGLWVLVALELGRAAIATWMLAADLAVTPGTSLEWLSVLVGWKTRAALHVANLLLLLGFTLRAAGNARALGAEQS